MELHLIIGPGRSGSSAIAARLSERGVNFGASLIGADPINAKGYVENPLAAGINQTILLQAASFNGDFMNHSRSYRSLSNIEEMAMDREIRDNFSGSAIGIKCPRFCLTLPSWRGFIESRFCHARMYVCLRFPIAVINSFVSTGRSRRHGGLWWASYIISALANTSPSERKIVEFESPHESPTSEIEGALIDLWAEVKETGAVKNDTVQAWLTIFKENEDWMPRACSAARSLYALRHIQGRASELALTVEESFPEYSRAWSSRDDYINADDPSIWRAYIAGLAGVADG